MLQGQKLQEAYQDFIFNYSVEKGLVENSIRNKKDILDGLIPFLKDRPLTPEACREYVNYKFQHGWTKPNSRRNVVKYLRSFINFLFDREYIDKNFSKKLVMPKVLRPPLKLISEESAEKVIIAGTEAKPFIFGKSGDNDRNSKIKEETRLCLLFILRTGLRINEALTLKGSDLSPFDEQPSFMVISKGGNASQLPIPDDMVEIMKLRTSRLRVFEATRSTCNKALKRGMNAVGLEGELTCHKLRDIYSLSRLRRGNSLQLVSRSLRHTSVAVTDKYYSNYILNDLVDVVNDSPLIRRNLTTTQLLEKALKAFMKIIENDPRIKIEIKNDGSGHLELKANQV